jgi:hypothetical protein
VVKAVYCAQTTGSHDALAALRSDVAALGMQGALASAEAALLAQSAAAQSKLAAAATACMSAAQFAACVRAARCGGVTADAIAQLRQQFAARAAQRGEALVAAARGAPLATLAPLLRHAAALEQHTAVRQAYDAVRARARRCCTQAADALSSVAALLRQVPACITAPHPCVKRALQALRLPQGSPPASGAPRSGSECTCTVCAALSAAQAAAAQAQRLGLPRVAALACSCMQLGLAAIAATASCITAAQDVPHDYFGWILPPQEDAPRCDSDTIVAALQALDTLLPAPPAATMTSCAAQRLLLGQSALQRSSSAPPVVRGIAREAPEWGAPPARCPTPPACAPAAGSQPLTQALLCSLAGALRACCMLCCTANANRKQWNLARSRRRLRCCRPHELLSCHAPAAAICSIEQRGKPGCVVPTAHSAHSICKPSHVPRSAGASCSTPKPPGCLGQRSAIPAIALRSVLAAKPGR